MQSNQINFYQNDKLNIKITSVNVFFVDFSNQPVFRHQTKINRLIAFRSISIYLPNCIKYQRAIKIIFLIVIVIANYKKYTEYIIFFQQKKFNYNLLFMTGFFPSWYYWGQRRKKLDTNNIWILSQKAHSIRIMKYEKIGRKIDNLIFRKEFSVFPCCPRCKRFYFILFRLVLLNSIK